MLFSDSTEVTSNDVSMVVPSTSMDTANCQLPGGNSVMQGVGCTMWCPTGNIGQTTSVTFKFTNYFYLNKISLEQESPRKTSDETIFIKKNENEYISIGNFSDKIVRTFLLLLFCALQHN